MLTIPAAMRRPCLPDAAPHRPPPPTTEAADDALALESEEPQQDEFIDILQVQRLLLDRADQDRRLETAAAAAAAADPKEAESAPPASTPTTVTTPTALREAFLIASGLHSTAPVTTTAPSAPPAAPGRVLQRQLGVIEVGPRHPGHPGYNVHYPLPAHQQVAVEDLFALWLNSTAGKHRTGGL
ncbi:hypothetical protein ONE63_009502 [Megalurothrips usitatus]|uniref:Uncharacterized protein n=1 Tax=Megalurothrips usitatus TaxID=439358 RepID=A0AAV7XMC9_9NEOP|nr:hypothetical protein ONE63_009502 [Megalurothrips usitatus]